MLLFEAIYNLLTLKNFTRYEVSNFVCKCVTKIIIIQTKISKRKIITFIENDQVYEHYYCRNLTLNKITSRKTLS